MHTGHSSLTDSPALRLRRCADGPAVDMVAAAETATRDVRTRHVPLHMTVSDRQAFVEIARRGQTEHVHGYAVLALGLHVYATAARLATPEQTGE